MQNELELARQARSKEHLHHLRSEAELEAKLALEAELARLEQAEKDAEEAAQEQRIVMLKSQAGSPDGNHVKQYEAGKTYAVPRDISASLTAVFLNLGVCEVVG